MSAVLESSGPNARPIRVLVVDDSATARDLLTHLLNSDPRIEVVGTATDGGEAVAAVQRLLPDVVTMDIHMPGMDGYAATRRIMETCPTRIVMVTGSSAPQEVAQTFRALEAGALTVVGRPAGIGHSGFDAAVRDLLLAVTLMSEIKVVRRWPRPVGGRAAADGNGQRPPDPAVAPAPAAVHLVAIGASTGGPLVLQSILSRLPRDFAAPIVIVQHIAAGFAAGFVEWLTTSSGFPVRVAADGQGMTPGIAYLAPDDVQMQISAERRIVLSSDPPENGLRPSVSYLFRSVAERFGPHAVGVLLTGMGRDGALELAAMKRAGAVTIAQDAESAVVNGMPGEAVKLGAAEHVLAPEAIAAMLRHLIAAGSKETR